MVIKPWDVTWDVVGYNDATEDLIVSDKEVMENGGDVSVNKDLEDNENTKFKALILKMSLPSSW